MKTLLLKIGLFSGASVILVGIAFAFVFGVMMLDAWAITILWKWFVVPIFSLHALSFLQAMGLALIVSFMTNQYNQFKKSTDNKENIYQTISVFSYILLRAPSVVLFGYIIKSLM